MKGFFTIFCTICVFLALWSGVDGQDKKDEVKLKGTVECAKCALAIETKCMTVFVDDKKVDGKDVIYYFDTDSHKKFHKDICQEAKKATVTGTVSEKGGKKFIAVSKVEY
jgi:hypothetical protein